MKERDLRERTKQFAVDVILLADELPRTPAGLVVGNQVIKAGTSVVANYRSSRVARSRREFASKLQIVLEEADETQYWLELIEATRLLPAERVQPLLREAGELTAIFMTPVKTTRGIE